MHSFNSSPQAQDDYGFRQGAGYGRRYDGGVRSSAPPSPETQWGLC